MMKNQINIADLLKDCPKGTKLYSPLCGECYFDRLNMGTIICKKQNTQEITFTSKGHYMLPVFDGCECMIFPSKDQRDWSKFQRPFKDGDIVVCTNTRCTFIAIFKSMRDDRTFYRYGVMFDNNFRCLVNDWSDFNDSCRLATEEEKEKLFQVIKDNGYKWNTYTKTLEKLVEPKFKVGNVIQDKGGYKVRITDVSIEDGCYGYESLAVNGIGGISFNRQDNWELVPNKFDINTLKTFDKVLMRSSNAREWVATFYSHYSNYYFFGCGMMCQQCIPYEGNQHLLGTTDDCDEYYKNW